jgi:hypothetical protein
VKKILCIGLFFVSVSVLAKPLNISVTIPELDANPYHKPYVAVWVETEDRQPIRTLALWVERDTWFKDLRQWWRKIGRSAGDSLDSLTGATRLPGTYEISWDGTDLTGQALEQGRYLIHFEASREEGGRSYQRAFVNLGTHNNVHIAADRELGEIDIISE